MAAEFCAVDGCMEYPATKRLELQVAVSDAEPVQVIVPLCAEHEQAIREWGKRRIREARGR